MRIRSAWLALVFLAAPLLAEESTRPDIKQLPVLVSNQPQYGLLMFGSEATPIWLVHDAQARTLYVDRNGDGDLTDENEAVAAETLRRKIFVSFEPFEIDVELLRYPLGELTVAGVQHTDVLLDETIPRNTWKLKLRARGKWREFSTGEIRFAPTTNHAPLICCAGDYRLRPSPKQTLPVGNTLHDFEVNLTAGDETAASNSIVHVEAVAADVHPVARFEFPHRDPARPPIVQTVVLDRRC